MPEDRPLLILIVGPTAVGKTDLALRLARQLNAEIVSADSRLFYRGMDIGTAKPTVAERAAVPHHLIDIVNPDETLSLAVFQRMAHEAIDGIQRRGRLPLLVGGTGQYVRAVTEAWLPPEVKPDEGLRQELGRLKEQYGGAWLHDHLTRLDPSAAAGIDPRNARRTIRALEVIFSTGRRFSEQRRSGSSPFQLLSIGLKRPRPELYARVDARIEAMFEAGLLEEVHGLLAQGYGVELPSMSAIGYRECVRVLRGEWTVEQAKAHIRRATHMYVRRQANWFKASDPHIHWFEAGRPDAAEAVGALVRTMAHDSHPPPSRSRRSN